MRVCLILVIAAFVAEGAVAQQAPAETSRTVTVGSKKFTESVILAQIAAQTIAAATAHPTEHRSELGGTRFLWNALQGANIDVYPEYTGTIRQEILAGQSVQNLREALEARGVGMTRPLGFNNTYALGMNKTTAEELGIETISDLQDHPGLAMAFSNEFMDRPDGWPGLRDHYDLPHQNVRGMDHDLSYRGLESGSVQVTDLYSTDAEIAYYDLEVLEDDRRFFPKYQAVYLYRLDLSPQAVEALQNLAGAITAERMTAMNASAKIDGRPASVIASDFLEREFAIESTAGPQSTTASRIWRHTKEHLYLVAISLVAAILLAIPLGVVAAKYDRLGQVILGIVGVIYTIPSLALLVFMIPLLGIGGPPAIVALFLYSLLPIVRNTHAGLKDIPSDVLESADALGLRPWAKLRLVELPLASRAILAGIKTSAVINIGTATLGALIGAGGYGQPILTGIRLDDVGLILEGAVPAAVLALFAQGAFELAERFIVPKGLRLTAD